MKNKEFLLYESIGKKIIEDIKNKVFLPGQKLPSEKELCSKYNISHLTVRRALLYLVEQKYVIRKKNVGTFVGDSIIDNNKQSLIPDDFIVVIINSMNVSFLTKIIESIESEASKYERSVVLCNSMGSFDREITYLNKYIKKGIRKFIVCPVGSDVAFYENLKAEHKLKIVFVDITPGKGTIPVVRTDDVDGAYRVTKYLLSIGHTRIVCIAGQKRYSTARDRVKGYVNAIGKKNAVILEGLYSTEGGYRAIYDFISKGNKLTAVFACSDLAAIGAKMALDDLKYKVPEDVSVFGYGNLDIGINYKLSTVNQHTELIGKLSVGAIETLFYDMKSLQKRLIIEPELIIRNSCMEINGRKS